MHQSTKGAVLTAERGGPPVGYDTAGDARARVLGGGVTDELGGASSQAVVGHARAHVAEALSHEVGGVELCMARDERAGWVGQFGARCCDLLDLWRRRRNMIRITR